MLRAFSCYVREDLNLLASQPLNPVSALCTRKTTLSVILSALPGITVLHSFKQKMLDNKLVHTHTRMLVTE